MSHKETFNDGPTYLNISRITIDSRSTVTFIRSTLSEQDKHMVKLDGDITQYNAIVKLQLDALRPELRVPSTS